MAKQTPESASDSRSDRRRSLGKTHADYWKARLFRPWYTRDGERFEVNDLAVRIQHGGRRELFTLATTNRDVAAIKARDIYTAVKGAGWYVALTRFKPDAAPPPAKLEVTFGDFLTAVHETRRLRERTFLNYQNCLRTIAAEALLVKPDRGTSKFDYRSADNGHARWIAKIDSQRLEALTPEHVREWKRRRLTRAGHSPAAQASARRTINSYVRCARSLFSRELLREVKGLRLPSPLPFDGVELEPTGSMKYVSKINAQVLIAAARNELKPAEPEAYKAFLLGLFAGMRKAEIDLAEWRMVDFGASVIRLEQTEWLHLKTEDSAAEIAVDPEVIAELRSMMPPPTDGPVLWSQFILASTRPPKPESPRPYYRCEDTFESLNAWLRGKGISANKPLHELRKELGALIATQHGIYAASKFLRHSDITTTARHYADQKSRISVGLGKFLDPTPRSAPGAPDAHALA